MRQPTIYIFKDEQLVQVISNKTPKGLPLFTCVLKEQINGEVSLSFSIPSEHPDSGRVTVGCWAVIEDIDGNFRPFVIVDEEETHDSSGMIREFITEELAVSELNDEVIEDIRVQDASAYEALSSILANTRWEVGEVADLGTKTTQFYYETVMSGIQQIIERWGGGELRFRVTLDSKNNITGRYVDIVERLGRFTGKRFEYGKDLSKVTRTVDIKSLKTAVYGRGKGEQTDSGGYGRRITFADIEWSKANGDPADKPLGQEWIGDPEALELWGYPNPDGTKRHRMGIYINEEITDKEELLKATWDYLQSMKQPQITYQMDVLDLEQVEADKYKHEAVRLGDSVYVIDRNFAWDVELDSRVIEIERDMINPENTKVTLGNKLGDIGGLVKQLQDRLNNKVGRGDPIGWLQGVIDAARSEFHSLNGYVYITDTDGILITNRPKDNIDNPPDKAIQLKAGALAIASGRNQYGEYDWKTFITGDQIIADRINSGRIRTDAVEIGDDSGKVLISGGDVTIKGGNLTVYNNADGSDNGVMIKGNKITTNFIRNAEFSFTPDPNQDWTLDPQTRYDATNKIISIDCTTTMPFRGISQWFDVLHPRATFQAYFKFNELATPKKVRFYFYSYDANGVQLDNRYREMDAASDQREFILIENFGFPTGTVRARVLVQAQMLANATNAVEIHWVKASYDDYMYHAQSDMMPIDVHNINAKPQIQAWNAVVTLNKTLSAGEVITLNGFKYDRPFEPSSGEPETISVIVNSAQSYIFPSAQNVKDDGFDLVIRALTTVSPQTLNFTGIAYKVFYRNVENFTINSDGSVTRS